MKIVEIEDRSDALIDELVTLWEASVRATHLFLSSAEVDAIKGFVPAALHSFARLIVAQNDVGVPVAFMGLENARLEALFVAPEERGRGVGRTLLDYAVERYAVRETTVNEQNFQAVGFYLRMGFETYKRTDVDKDGRPYPLLYMRRRD